MIKPLSFLRDLTLCIRNVFGEHLHVYHKVAVNKENERAHFFVTPLLRGRGYHSESLAGDRKFTELQILTPLLETHRKRTFSGSAQD